MGYPEHKKRKVSTHTSLCRRATFSCLLLRARVPGTILLSKNGRKRAGFQGLAPTILALHSSTERCWQIRTPLYLAKKTISVQGPSPPKYRCPSTSSPNRYTGTPRLSAPPHGLSGRTIGRQNRGGTPQAGRKQKEIAIRTCKSKRKEVGKEKSNYDNITRPPFIPSLPYLEPL